MFSKRKYDHVCLNYVNFFEHPIILSSDAFDRDSDAKKAAADEQLAAKIATDRLEAIAAQVAEHETKAAAQAQRIKELTSQVWEEERRVEALAGWGGWVDGRVTQLCCM